MAEAVKVTKVGSRLLEGMSASKAPDTLAQTKSQIQRQLDINFFDTQPI
jgi:hypothetical protein